MTVRSIHVISDEALDWLASQTMENKPSYYDWHVAHGLADDHHYTSNEEHFNCLDVSGIVVRGNDLYFPHGNENGDHYESLFIASYDDVVKFHGRTRKQAMVRCLVYKHFGTDVVLPESLL